MTYTYKSSYLLPDASNSEVVEKRNWKKPVKLEKDNPKTLSELIFRMVSGENTYFTNENGENISIHCERPKRSMEDIYRVAKYYFPKINIKDIIKVVNILVTKHLISRSFCITTNRFVHIRFKLTSKPEMYAKALEKLDINF